jgi:hypothetical protein
MISWMINNVYPMVLIIVIHKILVSNKSLPIIKVKFISPIIDSVDPKIAIFEKQKRRSRR